MNREIFRHVLITVLTLLSSAALNNSVFENKINRIETDDFSVIETSISFDKTQQVKTFFIKNNSNYPINNNNVIIKYHTNTLPLNANFTNSNEEFIPIEITNNPKLAFELNLPPKLRNEDFFSISVHYKSLDNILDKLSLKIESPKDLRYITIENNDSKLENFLNQIRKALFINKTVILAESFLILYVILFYLTKLFNWGIEFYKSEKDKNFINNRNKKQFLKR